MTPSIRQLLVVGVVALLVAAPVAAGAFVAGPETSQAAEVAPGAKLAGSVSVQGAELNGEVKERTFGLTVRNAANDRAKAAAVAEQVEEIQARMQELREQKQELIAAHENGTVTDATFRARMAALVAEMRSVQRLLADSESVAQGLPEDVLAEKGVNVSAIEKLRTDARNLTGPEVAEIARSVAGKNVGGPVGKDRGPAALPDAANGTDGNGPDDGPGAGNDGPGQGNGGPGDGQGKPDDPGRDETETPTPALTIEP